MITKVSYPQRINWINYKNYCYRNGLCEGNFNNLKLFMERNIKNDRT